jgi:CubicO group peptidase (beta-lactamase class C family)
MKMLNPTVFVEKRLLKGFFNTLSITLVFLIHFIATPVLADSLASSQAQQISTMVKAYAGLDMFSGTVLVAKNGQIIYEGAFGEANKDFGIPNNLNTKFNIGSIGKTFTAVAIMQLIEHDQLELSDPLGKFLPDFPFPEKDEITIYHLLTHTSGLGDYLEHEDYLGTIPKISRIDDVLPLVYD